MSLFSIAWKSIRQRMLSSSLTALSIALGVALMVTVLVINGVVSKMFNQTATGYDLIVGAKGSDLQLVLNAIYFMDQPVGNIPYTEYLRLKRHAAVAYAVPFALGDTTDDGKYRIVGTLPEFFEHEYVPGKNIEFAQGKNMKGNFDAVVGARVIRDYGWPVGHGFQVAHAGNKNDIHAEVFNVVGILKPTGTPIDRAVFVHFNGFFNIAGHVKPANEAKAEREAAGLGAEAKKDPGAPKDAVEADDKIPIEQKEVTAVLLRMKSPIAGFMMKSYINKFPVARAVNPIEQISKLMRTLVGNVRMALLVMIAMIILVSGVGIFVSIYNSMADRRREIAIMRALGASRTTVFSIIIAESLLLCVGGGVLGMLLGHGMVFAAGPLVEKRSDLYINPWSFEIEEIYLLPALIVLAVVVGVIPALTAYRADVARNLQD